MSGRVDARDVVFRFGSLEFECTRLIYGEAVESRKPLPRTRGTYKVTATGHIRLSEFLDFLQGRNRAIENWENEGGATA